MPRVTVKLLLIQHKTPTKKTYVRKERPIWYTCYYNFKNHVLVSWDSVIEHYLFTHKLPCSLGNISKLAFESDLI